MTGVLDTLSDYLREYCKEDVTNLLNDNNDSLHVSINVNLTHLHRQRPDLFQNLLKDVWNTCKKWDQALLEAQKQLLEGNVFLEPGYQVKENCHVRFVNLPQSDLRLKGIFPNNDHVGLFVQVKGTVVRMTQSRLLEFKKEYSCSKCKMVFTLEADYTKMFIFDIPRSCINPNGMCKGTLFPKNAQPVAEFCMDYQEIRIQELLSEKNVPSALVVTLENDLVDSCQPGECVTICGTIERRWRPLAPNKRSEVVITMRALSVCKDEEKVNFNKDFSEQMICVRALWQDSIDQMGQLNARDTIIKSICPEIHGMYFVKLAIALALCSGVEQSHVNGSTTRGHSHLLLVGDPGLAKSKLLKAAARIAVRSVHTTGMGCSAAGLTAAAVREEGEWQLEAGALVLADGGVCCIDEFNLMRENDKASIHEAMEQQTISMAKAGLVCKLSTRCVVIAATNPKNLYTMSEIDGPTSLNIGIGSPLLSRFDMVFVLRDERDPSWDGRVADHILNFLTISDKNPGLWDLERIQSHFLAVHEIKPKISSEASTILASYYQYCRSDPCRDPSRTSVRLLDSLNRLAQAHARLMFRDKVEGIDAVIIVRLIETTWGFGRLLNTVNILKEDLPLGPNENQIKQILSLLKCERFEECVLNELTRLSKSYKRCSTVNVERPLDINNLEKEFGCHRNIKKLKRSSENKENTKLNTDEERAVTKGRIETNLKSVIVESQEENKKVPNNNRRDVAPVIFPNFDDVEDEDFELDNLVPLAQKLENKQSTETANTAKTKAHVAKFPFGCNLDFNDEDLELDLNFIGETKHINNNAPSTSREKPGNSSRTVKSNEPRSFISKLEKFRNPSYIEKTMEVNIPQEKEPVIIATEKQNESPVLPIFTGIFGSQSSSHILACQEDDLQCLEFDL